MNTIPARLTRPPMAQASTRRLEIRPTRREALTRSRRIGLAVLALQLAILLAWSGVEAARHAQTGDFSGFYSAFYLIAHGTLIPAGWFQEQAILIQWPLALLGIIWPHPITLLIVQDFAIVGAETVAFLWICDLVGERDEIPTTRYCLTGLALLVLDPWIYWSASWDYHSEPLGALFAILAARALFRGRRIGVLWCLLTLLSGVVPAPYVVGIGLSLMFVRGRRLLGASLVGAGTVWFELMVKLGAGTTVTVLRQAQSHAAGGVLSRIAVAFPTVVHYWLDAVANVAPAGLVGVFTTPVIGIAATVMGENFSQGTVGNVQPSFQSIPLYIFVPVGTIVALLWLRRRFGARLADGLVVVSLINVAWWAAIWIPPVIPTWLRVTPSQALAITHIEEMIPGRDAVIASEGISGDFAGRLYDSPFLSSPTRFHLRAPYTWVVVAPYAGIETATVGQSAQLIASLAQDPRAKLAYVNNADVWAFRVRVPRHGMHSLEVGKPTGRYPAGLFATYGTAVRHGRLRSWYMEGNDHAPGPILWGDYFVQGVGRYRARVRVAGHGLAQAQIWDTTTNRELDARRLQLHGRAQTVSLIGAVTRSDPPRTAKALNGFGLFQIDPVPAYLGNVLEIRVYAESASTIKVLRVSLTPVK